MDCPVCGYEMAVKEFVEQDGVMIMICRNKQCSGSRPEAVVTMLVSDLEEKA